MNVRDEAAWFNLRVSETRNLRGARFEKAVGWGKIQVLGRIDVCGRCAKDFRCNDDDGCGRSKRAGEGVVRVEEGTRVGFPLRSLETIGNRVFTLLNLLYNYISRSFV